MLPCGWEILFGYAVHTAVGKNQMLANPRFIKRRFFPAAGGNCHVEEPGLVCRDEHGKQFRRECLQCRTEILALFHKRIKHDSLIREMHRQVMQGFFGIAGLAEAGTGFLDFIRFVRECIADIEVNCFFVLSA